MSIKNYLIRLEKEKQEFQTAALNSRKLGDKMLTEKIVAEKENKQILAELHNLKMQLDESLMNIADVENCRRKLSDENSVLCRQAEEAQLQASQLEQIRTSLKAQLETAQRMIKDEEKV